MANTAVGKSTPVSKTSGPSSSDEVVVRDGLRYLTAQTSALAATMLATMDASATSKSLSSGKSYDLVPSSGLTAFNALALANKALTDGNIPVLMETKPGTLSMIIETSYGGIEYDAGNYLTTGAIWATPEQVAALKQREQQKTYLLAAGGVAAVGLVLFLIFRKKD